MRAMLAITQGIAPSVDSVINTRTGDEYIVTPEGETEFHGPATENDSSQRLLDAEKNESGVHSEATVGRTKEEVRATAKAALAAPTPPVQAPAKQPEKPQAVAAPTPKPTTAPRKDPPKAPATPMKMPQPTPAPTKKIQPSTVAQSPVYHAAPQQTETPEARKLRRVTEMLTKVREREARGPLNFTMLHQVLNDFVNLLGIPMIIASASTAKKRQMENRAMSDLTQKLRQLKIDEALWPRFMKRN